MEFEDPSTGKPVETDLVSVTVTHADGPARRCPCPCLYGIGKRKGHVPARTI